MLRRPLLISLTLATLAGCEESPTEAPKTSAEAPARRLDALVFEDPAGSAAIDVEVRRLQEAQRAAPERIDGWILLGRAFVKKARQSTEPAFYENARACARRALTLRPDYPLALDLEAMVLMNQHRFAEAKAMVEAVLAKDPDDVLALGTLADAALELGQVEAAVRAADKMADLKPSLPAYARVAHLRWLHGDLEGAKQAYRAAMDAGRGATDTEPLAWVITEAATLFLRDGDVPGAQAGFQRALTESPGYPPAQAGLGRVALAEGRFAQAAQHFARSYEGSALAQTAWLWAQAAERANDTKQAGEARAKVLRLGRHGEGRVLAAMLAQEGVQLEEARAAIEAERKTRGGHITEDVYASVLLRQGDLRGARAAMDRALALKTPDPTAWAHDGLLHLAAGDRVAAKAQLDRAWAKRAALMPALADEVKRALASY